MGLAPHPLGRYASCQFAKLWRLPMKARVTVTRILLAGPFAWAFKKKKGGERYITVEGPDFAMIMEVPRKQIKDAIKFVAKVKDAAAKAS